VANASYYAFRDGIMKGDINLNAGAIKVALVRGYTYSVAHTFLSDVTTAGGVINGASAALANKTFTNGVFDADDTTITATASTSNHVLIVYQASAATGGADVAATAQRLCFYIDTGTNMPIAPAAGTVTVTWPNTTGKIYQLGS
jgi:hypothetical protein